MKYLLRFIAVAALLSLVGAVGVAVWSYRGKSEGERFVKRGAFREAQMCLRRYLWLFSRDEHARLMLAGALASDESLPSKQRWSEVFEQLQLIGDESPLAAEARLREARLTFLVTLQPARAEQLVRRAVELNPRFLEAWILLWKILDMTNRAEQSEPVFWRVLELTSPDERTWCLREWFLSQFAPGLANADLDRALGFLKNAETPGPGCEFQRLLAFRNAERDRPLNHAALARWFQREGDFEQALVILQEGAGVAGANEDRNLVFTLVETYLKAGQFDQAERYFSDWRGEPEGYEFWKLQGIILEEIHQKYAEAVVAYDKSLGQWPGPSDWRTHSRKAQCLRLIGKTSEAEKCQIAAEKLKQDVFGSENRKLLLEAVAGLNETRHIPPFIKYYEMLGRSEEAKLWRQASPLPGKAAGSAESSPF